MACELGIADLFETIVGQDDSAAGTGKEGLVALALARLGASALDAMMVGDRFYDVEGAAANGVPCVGVDFGTASREELERAGATEVVGTVSELAGALLGRRSLAA